MRITDRSAAPANAARAATAQVAEPHRRGAEGPSTSGRTAAADGGFPSASAQVATDPGTMRDRYRAVRRFTELLCEPLATEDYVVQTMTDVSPTKWHLAHVSWFFETFLLRTHLSGYRPLNPTYAYLFNSYYVQAGERHCRDKRGYISRPTVHEVYEYRAHVDGQMERLLESADARTWEELRPVLELGIHHEQQHQELILTDIKHVLSVNPLRPSYRTDDVPPGSKPEGRAAHSLRWIEFDEGVHEIGHDGHGFSFDNERPRHRCYLQHFSLADRLVTNGELLEFIEDGGYQSPGLWLSEGWATAQAKGWTEPFYWEKRDGRWWTFTLAGMRELDPGEPACHLSYFEADAYARWAGARLPTEQEWEVAVAAVPVQGNFVESRSVHPVPLATTAAAASDGGLLHQMYGDVWEWTSSSYSPYPGFEPLAGALGEYNGKFMCNQYVLRGGSCATSRTHIRPTYRNFFPPDACWQFTGLRLAR